MHVHCPAKSQRKAALTLGSRIDIRESNDARVLNNTRVSNDIVCQMTLGCQMTLSRQKTGQKTRGRHLPNK